ncbi:MAG: hypothetical protein KDA70_16540 [Planctomycetaceae bacterium]|nr:hypothetical protein [Planctomycetaceae bacterium]
MFPFHWLSTLQKQSRSRFRQSTRARLHRNRLACTPCIARATPRHAVELLEDRMLLTAFTVVNTNDSGEGSLRAAIEAANANAGADTISFETSLRGRTIVLGDELQITDDLTITGLGGLLTIDGNYDSRIFNIHAGDAETTIEVSISGLNLIRGYAEKGGAILSHGNLTLSDTQLYFNEASSKGGGLYHSDGMLSVTNCNFFSNDALEYGGAISALNCSIIINDSSFSFNTAEYGGAFFETALQIPMPEILIQNSTFIENTSLKSGGAIYSGNSIIDINDSLISNNSSGSNGGGLCNSLGHMTITNSTVSDNSALKSGGGIYTNHGVISAVNSTIFQNSATESGGGIYSSGGNIKLSNSTLSGNSANLDGGGVYLSGSRIYTVPRIVPICGTNVITPEEMSLLIPSTLSPSVSDLVDWELSYISPSLRTIETFKPKFNLENCTIVNNSAFGSGGGIFISGNSYDDMVNNIIAGNSAETYRQVSSSITTEFEHHPGQY